MTVPVSGELTQLTQNSQWERWESLASWRRIRKHNSLLLSVRIFKALRRALLRNGSVRVADRLISWMLIDYRWMLVFIGEWWCLGVKSRVCLRMRCGRSSIRPSGAAGFWTRWRSDRSSHQNYLYYINKLSIVMFYWLVFPQSPKPETKTCFLPLSVSHSVVLLISLPFYLSVYLSVVQFIIISIHPSIYLSVRPSICLSVHPSVCPSVYLSVCLSFLIGCIYLFIYCIHLYFITT